MKHAGRDGCRIAYRTSGREGAPAVVFSHSLGLDGTSWDAQAAGLEDRYFVVRIDTRGHGRSAAPPGPYSVETLALDVLAVCDRLGVERFHHVGLSLGGITALWLAVHRGERLRSAVFCNTAARLGQPALWDQRIAAVRAGGMAAIADLVVGRFFTEAFAASEPVVVQRAREHLLATDPEGYAGCCAALRDADLRPRVAEIAVPSLVIGAAGDQATPPAEAEWLCSRIAGSELVVLEAAGHVSNLERPGLFNEALARHLDRPAPPHSPG
jgi:3-oxoadipate enol-lactonase